MISVLSETQERFFLAIAKQLPLDRVIELHLFQPMRQGGVESGVAVVAAVPEGESLVDTSAPMTEEDPSSVESPEAKEMLEASDESLTTGTAHEAAPALTADEAETLAQPRHEPATGDAKWMDASGDEAADTGDEEGDSSDDDGDPETDTAADDAGEAPSGSMDAEGMAALDGTERAMEGVELHEGGELRLAREPERPRRYTVYTAHYRHVLKGPDRGKWEVSVVAEADAPLLTVDVVVRGVLRRSGDAGEPERLSGDEVRRALRQTGGAPG